MQEEPGMDRRWMLAVAVLAFVLCAAVTKTHVVSWNDGSRMATVDALTADRTFKIDGSPFAVNLGDKISFQGRTYSDKPPLLAVLGAGVASAVAPLGITLRRTPSIAIYLVTLFTVGIAFAIGCAYAFAFARLRGYPRRVAAATAALTGAGTLALPYAAVLANHVPAGAAALAGCYHLVRGRAGGAGDVALAGLCFALAYAFDPASAVFAIAAAVLLWGLPLRRWLLALAAALPVIALQVAYNLRITGSIVPPTFNASVWQNHASQMHDWSVYYHIHPPLEYAGFALNLIAGSRGLFSFTPLMFVAAYGFVLMIRSGGIDRRIALAIGATFLVYVGLIVFVQNDADASNFGERRYVDLFFALCIPLAPALVALRGPLERTLVALAATTSIAIAALGTVAPFAGRPGESGFAFGSAEFVALVHRAPVQAGLDILALAVLIGLVVRLLPGPADGAAARAGFQA